MWNTSRIFSSARCSAGEGGSVGAANDGRRAGRHRWRRQVVDACDDRRPPARSGGSRSSARRRRRRYAARFGLGRCRNGISTAEAACGGPGFVVGTQAQLLLNRARTCRCGSTATYSSSHIPSLRHCPRALLQSCKLPAGRREEPRPQPTHRAPVRAQKTRKPRASIATLARSLGEVHASFRLWRNALAHALPSSRGWRP